VKVIIAGGRDFDDRALLFKHLDRLMVDAWKPDGWTKVLSGAARDADALGEFWATQREIAVELFPADWNKFGKSAGVRRNEDMAAAAQVLVAFWDGQSRGTRHMISCALKAGLETHVIRYSK